MFQEALSSLDEFRPTDISLVVQTNTISVKQGEVDWHIELGCKVMQSLWLLYESQHVSGGIWRSPCDVCSWRVPW